jgi:hypothetical protein
MKPDRTTPDTQPRQDMQDPCWDVDRLEKEEGIFMACLSLRYAGEILRACVAYDEVRVPGSQQARRIRYALDHIQAALHAIT